MYQMRNIITHADPVTLPTCMYSLRPIYDFDMKHEIDSQKLEEFDINIKAQVAKLIKPSASKMAELEQRQEQLLKKLDVLYDRIKTLSALLSKDQTSGNTKNKTTVLIADPDEALMVFNPINNMPYFLNIILKKLPVTVNVTYHIHSSVANEIVPRIKSFMKTLPTKSGNGSKINLRLIFSCVSADSELKLSSLSVPLVGTVNILRYLSYVYPNIIKYDSEDQNIDSLLDTCHLLEKTSASNKDALVNKLFANTKNWIYKNELSIVDIATYNVIKQWKTKPSSVPKEWLLKCEKL